MNYKLGSTEPGPCLQSLVCWVVDFSDGVKCIKVIMVFSDLIKAPSNQWIELSAKLGFHYFLLLTKNQSTRQNVIHELTEKANNFLFKFESVPGFNSSCLYDFTSYSWELRSWIFQHQNKNNYDFAALLRRRWSYLEIKEKFGLSSIRLTILAFLLSHLNTDRFKSLPRCHYHL